MTLDMEIQDMKRRTAIRERKKGIEEGIYILYCRKGNELTIPFCMLLAL